MITKNIFKNNFNLFSHGLMSEFLDRYLTYFELANARVLTIYNVQMINPILDTPELGDALIEKDK